MMGLGRSAISTALLAAVLQPMSDASVEGMMKRLIGTPSDVRDRVKAFMTKAT